MVDFGSIKGKREVVESMLRAVESDRVGHAYILNGPEGIGKKTLSQAFAALLLCSGKAFPDLCGSCMPCRLISSGANPDLKILDKGEKSIIVDEIRDIQQDVNIKPMYSARKVYIINEAGNMTVQAQNCLLKTLEEPPSYTVILLNVSNMEAMLPTIRSRATAYTLKKNTYEEVYSFLAERFGRELPGLNFIAAYSDGIIGTAVKLAKSGEFTTIRENTIKLLLGLQNSSRLKAFEEYSFFDSNRDNIDTILKIMMLFYRDLLVAATTGNEKILINSDKKDIIFSNVRYYTPQRLIRNIETINTAYSNIDRNANYQLSLEVMLMKLQED
jgi:DNA polymerase-3 subunit delta'